MTNNERFSQLEEMISDVLKRLDQVTLELRATNEALHQQGERQDSMLQQQRVILDVLVRQTDTNTAILRRLENHENRLRDLEDQGPKTAA